MKETVDGRVARHEDSPVEITIRRWSAGGIALAIVLTGFGGFLSWRSVRQSGEDSDWVAHTHAVNVALDATLTHAVDVETGTRGFGATGDETFLEPFFSGRLALHSNLDTLTHLTADNSGQQQRLQTLGPQIDAGLTIAEETIAERRRTGAVPSAATFMQGKQRMDAVRATIDEMWFEEARLLDQRMKRSEDARRKTNAITLVSTLAGVLLLLFAGLVTSQQIGHSTKLRGQIQALNKDLEWRVEDRTKKLQAEVNERKRAEDATLASERRYRQLFECSNDGICFNEMVFDSEGQPCDFRWLDINPRYEVLTGLTRQQVVGRRALEVLPTLERHWLDLFSRVVATGSAASFEQFALPLGRRYQGNAYRTGEGKFAVSFTDVTERRQAEEALQESGQRLEGIIESAMDAIIAVDEEQRIVVFNEAAQKIFRCPAAQALGQPLERFIPQRFRGAHAAHIRNFGETATTSRGMGALGALRALRADGEEFQIEASISQVKSSSKRLFSVILRDVTEQAIAAKAQRDLASIVTFSHDAIIGKNLDGIVTSWNPGAEKIYGYSAQEMIGKSITTPIPSDRIDDFHTIMQTIARGEDLLHYECVRIRKDGQPIHVSLSISPMRDDTGKIVGASTIARDITERMQVERRLRESEEKYRTLFNSIVEGFCIVEVLFDENQKPVDYRFLEISPSFEAQTGLKDAQGKRMRELAPRHEEHWFEVYGKVALTGEPAHFENKAADLHRWHEVYANRVGEPSERKVAIVFFDITARKQAEEALRGSEETLRLFVEHAPAALAMFDRDMRYLRVSRRWRTDYGVGDRDLRGLSHYEVFPKVPERWKEAHRRGLAGKVVHEENDRFPLADGAMQWIRWEVRPWHETSGAIGGIVIFTEDITAHRQAEEALRLSNARTRFALENAKIGDWQLDLTTLQATRSLLHDQIFGYRSLLPEWNFDIFLRHVHPDDRESVRDNFQSCASQGKRWEFECRIICAGGKMRWIWACGDAQKESSGGPSGMFGIVQDITERKLAEEEIQTLNYGLEQRVRERTAQLEAANKELEAFTYSVSHDLRAPLRHISGFSKMLVEEFASTLPPDAQHYLERIQGGTLRMGVLVDDLLNLGRVGRQALRLQVAGLRTIVDELIDELQPECVDRLVEWRIGALPSLDCDPGLLKQVFQNLIANALKFTRPRAAAIIEVGQQEEGGAPVIFVRDNGVGFSMKYSGKLFGVFQRLHRQEDFEGTGVGLATVQRIITKHGGRVWVEAELDKGATFYFTIGSTEHNEIKTKAAIAGEKS